MFNDSDLDAILDATGEPVQIRLSGVLVATLQGKFRRDYQDVSPYDASVGVLVPAVLLRTTALAGIDLEHSYTIGGVEYAALGAFEPRNDGLTLIKLTTEI